MKILIWDLPHTLKRNMGGPGGYLYNIQQYLKEHTNYSEISFASDLLLTNDISQKIPQTSSLKSFLFNWYQSKKNNKTYRPIIKIIRFCDALRDFYTKKNKLPINIKKLAEFDAIHFHSTIHMGQIMHLLDGYNGKIVLTTHCPEPYSIEILEGLFNNKILINLIKPIFLKKEIEGWKNADRFLFPVQESVEVYFKCSALKKYYYKNKKNFYYCPSSISTEVELKNIPIKQQLGIPDNSFVVSYVGRHNTVKGYDQLKIFANSILNKYDNVHFVIAGIQTPLVELSHPKWHELGQINYVADLLNQSDVFVLPNRETYFDLVTLEVLRIGTPLLLTNTGGNRYFHTLPPDETSGMVFYEYGNLDSQIAAFESLYTILSKEKADRIRTTNRALFNKYFSTEKFIKRYIKVMNEIINSH